MFTMRQLICVSIAALLCFVIAVLFDMEFSLAVYPSIVIGAAAFAFGWVRQDGLTFEKLLLKWLQKVIYRNHIRTYHTKNGYIALMNDEYARHRAKDEGNHRIVRLMKKETRHKKWAKKQAKCRGFE